ncbi:MAG: molybdate ABC transporter substrate-binding protein [Firmicutes bacterium]|nr:molybdate ABC transporter substrate-binding protein [Bacillota bacterium]
MKKSILLLFLAILVVMIYITSNAGEKDNELTVYAGAGLKAPLEEIAEKFNEKEGIKVEYNFAGCGQHLSQMENTEECDVFIAGSSDFAKIAIDKGYINSYQDLVKHIPAIATSKNLELDSIEELFSSKYIMAQGDEKATAIGKVAKKIYMNLGREEIKNSVKDLIVSPTANQLLIYIENGNADFAIVWEDMTINDERFNTYDIPKESNLIKEVPIAITKFSDSPEISNKFLNYIKSEEGYKVFEKHGFKKCKE